MARRRAKPRPRPFNRRIIQQRRRFQVTTIPDLADLLTDSGLFWMRTQNESSIMATRYRDHLFVCHLIKSLGTPEGVIRKGDVHNAFTSVLDDLSDKFHCVMDGIEHNESIIDWIVRRGQDYPWIKDTADKKIWPEMVYRLVQARKLYEETADADIKIFHYNKKNCPELTIAITRFWLISSKYWERDASVVLALLDPADFLLREQQLVGWTPNGYDTLLCWALSEGADADAASATVGTIKPVEVVQSRHWKPAEYQPIDDSDECLQIEEILEASPDEMRRFLSHVDLLEEDDDIFIEKPQPIKSCWRSNITGGWQLAKYLE